MRQRWDFIEHIKIKIKDPTLNELLIVQRALSIWQDIPASYNKRCGRKESCYQTEGKAICLSNILVSHTLCCGFHYKTHIELLL